ncbi:hypothetical protein BUALT_Bualt02G0187900 [Buddleja alternifolia]|uniref:DUF4283 domain-containing protein n=1 Tax=Buddleja alternifolia TaxID=168488 RepID=A0AAV6Y2L1_9LAMI|nr:hypothetical protein BUALT_Bualt02G0187900 [Buddleja alternifolia]
MILNALVDTTSNLNVTSDPELSQFEEINAFTLIGRILSKKSFNPNAVKNALLKAWNPRFGMEMNSVEENNGENLDSALFWVQARNLPVRSINTITAKIIEDTIGRFVKTDLVSENQRWMKALRIRVELNVHKPLTDSIKL